MPARNRLILLVEDEEADAFLIERSLLAANARNRVRVAKDGEQALEILFKSTGESGKTPPEVPALVLLDLKLPGMGGLEVLEKIRSDQRTRSVPVVVITSSREERDRVWALNLGADKILQKAVDFADFARAIQDLGLHWLVLGDRLPEPPAA
jgi:two-component system response regulator